MQVLFAQAMLRSILQLCKTERSQVGNYGGKNHEETRDSETGEEKRSQKEREREKIKGFLEAE